MTTTVKQCSCQHEYQDSVYGKKMRLMNRKKMASKDATPTYKCTVCNTQHKGN